MNAHRVGPLGFCLLRRGTLRSAARVVDRIGPSRSGRGGVIDARRRPAPTRVRAACAVGALAALTALGAQAAELAGQVIEAASQTARIRLDSNLVPSIGDQVEIYFKLPPTGDAVTVARARVADLAACRAIPL
jgi:hypothetical protein